MVNPLPKTKSDSSATQMNMKVPDYNGADNRISYPPISTAFSPLDQDPIKVTHEVKYKEYTNGKRMTEDFGMDTQNDDMTANFDGTKTMMPQKDDNSSDICTDFSKS